MWRSVTYIYYGIWHKYNFKELTFFFFDLSNVVVIITIKVVAYSHWIFPQFCGNWRVKRGDLCGWIDHGGNTKSAVISQEMGRLVEATYDQYFSWETGDHNWSWYQWSTRDETHLWHGLCLGMWRYRERREGGGWLKTCKSRIKTRTRYTASLAEVVNNLTQENLSNAHNGHNLVG